MTFETLTSIKPYGGRDSNVMFDPLGSCRSRQGPLPVSRFKQRHIQDMDEECLAGLFRHLNEGANQSFNI
ncbi:MAG TPA: hypothetical protein VKA94_12545, partial [Hyphomicrobiales bacterium]|nr:hypothetical protein [Hyphomicrobiales bacterium]